MRSAPSLLRSLSVLSAPLLFALACAPVDRSPAVGTASGAFDCQIFLPGAVPANYGDGNVAIAIGSTDKTLAQGAAAFAIDSSGHQTLDPSQASYFAVQIFQQLSTHEIDVFEIDVVPAEWTPGDVTVDGTDAGTLFGRITTDDNGIVVDSRILARATGGVLHLDATGTNPREPVSGSFSPVDLVAE